MIPQPLTFDDLSLSTQIAAWDYYELTRLQALTSIDAIFTPSIVASDILAGMFDAFIMLTLADYDAALDAVI